MTEWHARYGGRGVMIYWHVEKHSTCIYSQLRRCSSSEVAAMIEGVLRHCTDMEIERQYVDSHGQSEVAFAFSHLLSFDLLPRLKGIARQRLYLPVAADAAEYPALAPILTRAINWDLIGQQYDEMVKYTTALRIGTADPEAILRRFTRNNPPDVSGARRTWQGHKDNFFVSLPARGSLAPGDSRRSERRGELEQCQRLHLLRRTR
jgi:TnpA family transposase